MSSAAESVMKMFIMSLGNFGDTYSALECTDHNVSGKVGVCMDAAGGEGGGGAGRWKIWTGEFNLVYPSCVCITCVCVCACV